MRSGPRVAAGGAQTFRFAVVGLVRIVAGHGKSMLYRHADSMKDRRLSFKGSKNPRVRPYARDHAHRMGVISVTVVVVIHPNAGLRRPVMKLNIALSVRQDLPMEFMAVSAEPTKSRGAVFAASAEN